MGMPAVIKPPTQLHGRGWALVSQQAGKGDAD